MTNTETTTPSFAVDSYSVLDHLSDLIFSATELTVVHLEDLHKLEVKWPKIKYWRRSAVETILQNEGSGVHFLTSKPDGTYLFAMLDHYCEETHMEYNHRLMLTIAEDRTITIEYLGRTENFEDIESEYKICIIGEPAPHDIGEELYFEVMKLPQLLMSTNELRVRYNITHRCWEVDVADNSCVETWQEVIRNVFSKVPQLSGRDKLQKTAIDPTPTFRFNQEDYIVVFTSEYTGLLLQLEEIDSRKSHGKQYEAKNLRDWMRPPNDHPDADISGDGPKPVSK